MAGYKKKKSTSRTISLDPVFDEISSPDEETTRLGIYRCTGYGAVLGWMGEGDREPEPPKFPSPRDGQKLIGHRHVEAGDQPDELHYPYSIEPGYDDMDHMVAEK